MPQQLKDVLNWIKENVLAVLIASFVIPGTLAVFNQQAEVTKAIYETDYKAAKAKFLECNNLNTDYLSAATTNAGTALVLQEHFNVESIAKYGASEVYFVAFKGTMDGYQKSLERVGDLFSKTSRCYADLNALYENLALTLNLNAELQDTKNRVAEQIVTLTAKRDAIAKDLQKRADPNAMFRAMITGDSKAAMSLMQTANFGDLAKLQSGNIELETAIHAQQQTQFNELNAMFSGELSKRFHRGLLSYFWSLFRI
jgi:hypothetical protein